MEDDTDIYGDLANVEIKLEENFVANQTESNTREYAELKKQIAELTSKLEDCRKVKETLEVNLVSLLKTAKAEITRKDKAIEDLRKQLDDVAFRRGGRYRTNDRVPRKPTFAENCTIRQQITEQISLPLSQPKCEPVETDSSYNPTKNSTLSKSTLAPLTVFGERLLKRIAETQTTEKRAKQPSRFGSNNSCATTTDGYVVESDKENGSVKEYSEKKPFATTDCSAEGRNEIDSTDVAGIADGGEKDGVDRTMNKCIKSEVKEYASRSTNKESCEDVNIVSDKKYEHTRAKRFEYSEKYTDSRFNTERNRYSSFEQQSRKRSHRSSTVADQPSENDADEHLSKRHCKSVERLSITTDDYRSSSVERRRPREDRRSNETWGDRRLRGSSRDEKYTRHKSDKYNNYRERSVRRYDNNFDSTDCSKATIKRESRDSRSVEKSARSINKRSDRSEDYECQSKERLRYIARRAIDKSDGEKPTNRTRYPEDSKPEKPTDKCLERSDRRRFAGNYETLTTTKPTDLSRKQQNSRNKDSKNTDANGIALDPSICNDEKPKPSVVSVDATNTNNVVATIVSLGEQNVGNVATNESSENVENIEKFIRNYNTADGNKTSLDDKNDTSKMAEEHESTAIDVFKDQTNLEEQRDTIPSDETNIKLEPVESKDALQEVPQGSSGNDTKEETTTVPSLVEHEKSNKVLESNDSETNGELPSSNTTSTFQISEPGCNVNVDDKNKDNDETHYTNVPRNVEADKPNGNCEYSVPDIAKGNDNDHDDKTVQDEEAASKELGRAELAEKLEGKLENEEGKVNKGKKETSKAVMKQGPREMENRKNTSTNLHGKIIVFARRKKPVRLANNNANMTVLINNSLNNS